MDTETAPNDGSSCTQRFKNGDPTVLSDLCELCRNQISGHLHRHFRGGLRRDEIDDVLSIALYRAWKRREQFDEHKGTLSSWLLQIAKNAGRDYLRTRWQRLRRLEVALPKELWKAVSTSRNNDESPAAPTELLLALGQLMAELPLRQRQVLEADANSPDGQMCSSLLAQELGGTPAAVRMARSRGLKNLRAACLKLGLGREIRPEYQRD